MLCILSVALFCYFRINAKCCTEKVYAKAPEEIQSNAQLLNDEVFFTNTVEEAYPQTIVYAVVHDFMQKPLAEGKLEKKILVLGFDGFRLDALETLLKEKDTSIAQIAKEGGLYITYAGGTLDETQETSTAPGWASILSGAWSAVTEVYDNEDVLSDEVDTFLMEYAREGISSAFISSWDPHFDITYQNDIQTIKNENLPISYVRAVDDDDILQTTLNYLVDPSSYAKADEIDPDIVFTIFEYSDHAGHTSGYGADNAVYMQACKDADEAGKQILQAIENRKNYANEEWLIVMTTDHGGNEMAGHGGQSELERTTWLATNYSLPFEESMKNE